MRARRTIGTASGSASSLARLTGYLLQAKNDPPSVGQALLDRRGHCPAFAREGQFFLDPFAFEKQAEAVATEKRLGQIQQSVKRRASASGDDLRRMWRHSLDAARADRHIGSGDARCLTQKGASARIRLDELDTWDAEDCENQPRKPGAAAEVG